MNEVFFARDLPSSGPALKLTVFVLLNLVSCKFNK